MDRRQCLRQAFDGLVKNCLREGLEGNVPQHESERLPLIDLTGETERHVFVARGTEEVYQGHPTTVLMPDGKTMFCTWCIDHGGHCGPMARSDDGGLTWLTVETPENWLKVHNFKLLHQHVDPGNDRQQGDCGYPGSGAVAGWHVGSHDLMSTTSRDRRKTRS